MYAIMYKAKEKPLDHTIQREETQREAALEEAAPAAALHNLDSSS